MPSVEQTTSLAGNWGLRDLVVPKTNFSSTAQLSTSHSIAALNFDAKFDAKYIAEHKKELSVLGVVVGVWLFALIKINDHFKKCGMSVERERLENKLVDSLLVIKKDLLPYRRELTNIVRELSHEEATTWLSCVQQSEHKAIFYVISAEAEYNRKPISFFAVADPESGLTAAQQKNYCHQQMENEKFVDRQRVLGELKKAIQTLCPNNEQVVIDRSNGALDKIHLLQKTGGNFRLTCVGTLNRRFNNIVTKYLAICNASSHEIIGEDPAKQHKIDLAVDAFERNFPYDLEDKNMRVGSNDTWVELVDSAMIPLPVREHIGTILFSNSRSFLSLSPLRCSVRAESVELPYQTTDQVFSFGETYLYLNVLDLQKIEVREGVRDVLFTYYCSTDRCSTVHGHGLFTSLSPEQITQLEAQADTLTTN